jgi:hypothetical protein
MPRNSRMSVHEAQNKVLDLIAAGFTVKDAMAEVGRTVKTFENWRTDRDYARKVDETRDRRKRALTKGRDEDVYQLDFAAWRKRFLERDTFLHQHQWIDLLEGKEPRDMHPALLYTPGRQTRLLINTPPFHAKSSTITVDYATYCLCMNPNYRIIIVSKTQDQAKKFLYSIKRYLTSPMYAGLQAAYAPPDGFKGREGEWSSTKVYLSGNDSAEKDPNVEALGIGGQIYGARADLIILDDAVTLSNANEHEKQLTWINQEVASRLKDGKLLCVGTRVAAQDLYSELLNADNYVTGKSPWTYLGQPAVLEFAEEPADWHTLWPKSTNGLDENSEPDDEGMYDAWSGPSLEAVRSSVSATTWARTYMQQEVAEDAVFHPIAVKGSIDGRRKPGPLIPGALGHPRTGMENMHVIGSIDPAGTGLAFILIYAVHRQTKERYVLNCWTRSNTVPSWYADQIEMLTPQYRINEWTIEQNAYASWLIHDERIKSYLQGHGVKLTPTFTSRNKQDPDFGVATMESLFGTSRKVNDGAGRLVHNGDNIIHLPDPDRSEGMKALVEQLITWQPGKLGRQLRQDGPMALWFAETVARRVLGYGQAARAVNFTHNPYAARRDVASRVVIPADTYRSWSA